MLFELPVKSLSADMGSVQHELNVSALMDARKLKDFKKLLFDFAMGSNVHYYTGGNWSLHELIAYLLSVTGPADVYFSTWAIRENAIREMINWRESGFALSIHALLDKRSSQRDKSAVLLAEKNFTSVNYISCHAKVTVIKNDLWCIAVNSSQNYTKNPRIESGVISFDRRVVEFHLNWMQNFGK